MSKMGESHVSVPEVMSSTTRGIQSLKWVAGSNGSIPEYAVPARDDKDVTNMFVGRTWFNRDLIPGPVVPKDGCIYIPMDGSDNRHEEYEVLTNPEYCKLVWVHTEGGDINPRAVAGGHNKKDGTTYYIGRHKHENHPIIGRVHPTNHELFVPHKGSEHKYTEYEVLVCESE